MTRNDQQFYRNVDKKVFRFSRSEGKKIHWNLIGKRRNLYCTLLTEITESERLLRTLFFFVRWSDPIFQTYTQALPSTQQPGTWETSVPAPVVLCFSHSPDHELHNSLLPQAFSLIFPQTLLVGERGKS